MEVDTSVRDYLRIIFRHKIVIIVSVIVVMLTVFMKLELDTPVYNAQVKMLLAARWQTDEEYYKGLYYRTETAAEWVTSPYVIKRVVKSLKLYQRPLDYEKRFASKLKAILIEYNVNRLEDELKEMSPEQRESFFFEQAVANLIGNISIDVPEQSNIFTINVSDYDPRMAMLIANSLSRSYLIFDLEKQIEETRLQYGDKHARVIRLQKYAKNLLKTLDGKPISDLEAVGPASVKIVAQALGAGISKTTNKNIRLIIAFFVSIILGVAIALGIEYLNQSFRSTHEIEKFLNIPCLWSIPKRKSKEALLVSDSNPANTNYTHSYQILSDEISLLMRHGKFKTLLITDAEGTEETSGVVANIGSYLSRKGGYKVLLIDANLRMPSVSKIFNISNDKGLAEILEDKIKFEDGIKHIDSNLDFLPAGETIFNPGTLLDSSLMSGIIEKAKNQYEIVLINCADLRNFTDSTVIASQTDATAIVINEGKVSRYVIERAISPLRQEKVHIMGVIFNNRTHVIPEIIYKMT
ncbi:MAG TPA: polysaccharide biosynthesis tyrosine autokinase [Nitrospirae bacterium]|nr:tyrosine-protein kinase YwqD [bacterium BMS3Abin06]HDH13257.1 polysaccharide biosynthesis tyrosine autokinase [Nitrospirota bacterium]HDZ01775.1 polysaccharide biosynthesis tyrosine autokinase [Nitrospirota bacterium]